MEKTLNLRDVIVFGVLVLVMINILLVGFGVIGQEEHQPTAFHESTMEFCENVESDVYALFDLYAENPDMFVQE